MGTVTRGRSLGTEAVRLARLWHGESRVTLPSRRPYPAHEPRFSSATRVTFMVCASIQDTRAGFAFLLRIEVG